CDTRKRRRWRNEVALSDHSPSGNHGKGARGEGNSGYAGFPGGPNSNQDGNQGSGAGHLQSEGGLGSHSEFSGKRAAARQFRRLSSGLEEGVRKIEIGREDARVRTEPVVVSRRSSSGGMAVGEVRRKLRT